MTKKEWQEKKAKENMVSEFLTTMKKQKWRARPQFISRKILLEGKLQMLAEVEEFFKSQIDREDKSGFISGLFDSIYGELCSICYTGGRPYHTYKLSDHLVVFVYDGNKSYDGVVVKVFPANQPVSDEDWFKYYGGNERYKSQLQTPIQVDRYVLRYDKNGDDGYFVFPASFDESIYEVRVIEGALN
jgi:hypothetical protein